MKFKLTFFVPIILFLLFVMVSFWGLYAITTGQRSTSDIGFSMEGQYIPAISLLSLDKQTTDEVSLDLADWQGKAYAINVWASWCPPCRAEAPAIHQLSKSLPVLGINQRDKYEDAMAFLDQFGNLYQQIGVDPNGKASISIGVQALPETLIIAPDGRVILHHRGPIFANELEGSIHDALTSLGINP
jgi:cytochrome c biogenesis protein CcmG/thiol:disulfide interchange protein DsbE